MAVMLRHKRTGEITPATPAMKKDDAYELVEVELHLHLYRTDAAGDRYDRVGNMLNAVSCDVELKPAPKRRSRAAKMVASQVDVADLEVR